MDGNQPPATSDQKQVTGNQQPVASNMQSANDQLLYTNHQSPVTPSTPSVGLRTSSLGTSNHQTDTAGQIPPYNHQPASEPMNQDLAGQTRQVGSQLPAAGDQTMAQGQLGVAAQPTQPQPTPVEPVSVPSKEVEVGQGEPFGEAQGENVPLVELKEDERIPEDVQGWVEKLQKEEVKLPEPVKDGEEVVLAEPQVTFKDDKIVLPVTRSGYMNDMKQKVTESAKWLATWVGRLIKMLGERAKFREETAQQE